MQSACNLGSKGKQEGAFTNLSFQLGLDRSIHSYDSKLILSWFVCHVTASQPAPYICWWENGDYKTVCVCVCACVCVCPQETLQGGGTKLFFDIYQMQKQSASNSIALCVCVVVIMATCGPGDILIFWVFQVFICLSVCGQTLVSVIALQPCMDVVRARRPEVGR